MEKIIAVIDIGSNTVKLAIYEIRENNLIKRYTKSIYLRLFNYLESKKQDSSNSKEKLVISKKGIIKTKEVLKHFKEELNQYNPYKTIAFATYVVRIADNKHEFIKAMKEYFDIRVLSEQEEAYFSAYGALLDTNLEKGIICDMGGGSLEICYVKNNNISHCNSYPLGTLYFKEFFKDGVLVDEKGIIKKIRGTILKGVKNSKSNKNFEILVGVGGSIRVLSKIVGKKKIKKSLLTKTLDEIKHLSPDEISKNYGVSEKRSETVVSAALTMLEIMNIYGCDILVISKYGIREGIVLNSLNKVDCNEQ